MKWNTGEALKNAQIQTPMITFSAREILENVWKRNGKQMAIQRSMENAAIVNTDALLVTSDR